MSFVLSTVEARVRWYRFPGYGAVSELELHEVLDLKATQPFATKEAAKAAAIAAGLTSWRYFKF